MFPYEKFRSVEIHTVMELPEGIIERIYDEEQRDALQDKLDRSPFFSVYLKHKDGTLQCIIDTHSSDIAIELGHHLAERYYDGQIDIDIIE